MWHSTMSVLTWKPKVTPRNRLLFQLAVSKLPIVEKESGSSEKMWATPQAMDGLRVNQVRKKEDLTDKAKKGGCSNLREQVIEQPEMWLTPSATNIAKRSEEGMEKREKMRNDRGRKTVPPGSLAEQVDYGYPIKDMKQADMWPTPSSRDYKGGSGTVKEKDGKYYRQSNTTGTKFGVRLDALVEYQENQKMWPTPRANNGNENYETSNKRMEKRKKEGRVTGGVRNLATEVQMWPTPRANNIVNKRERLTPEGRLSKDGKQRFGLNLQDLSLIHISEPTRPY